MSAVSTLQESSKSTGHIDTSPDNYTACMRQGVSGLFSDDMQVSSRSIGWPKVLIAIAALENHQAQKCGGNLPISTWVT